MKVKKTNSTNDPYFKPTPGSGMRSYTNAATGQIVKSFAEAVAENDKIANLVENILPLKKASRIKPSTSFIAINQKPALNTNLKGIDELIKVRKDIVRMRIESEHAAHEFQKRFMNVVDIDNKGLAHLMGGFDVKK